MDFQIYVFSNNFKIWKPKPVNLVKWLYQSVSKNENLIQMYVFIDMVITRAKNWSPDMILTAFDGKFHEQKDEIPPRACRPSKTLNKNNVQGLDLQQVEKQKMSKKWTPNKLKKNNVEKVGLYILIYLHIPSYTSKYLQIAL